MRDDEHEWRNAVMDKKHRDAEPWSTLDFTYVPGGRLYRQTYFDEETLAPTCTALAFVPDKA
jgi:hypothetical protein